MLSALVYAFFLLAIFGVITGTIYYFYREHRQNLREEKRGFRAVLLQQLRKRGATLNFRQLAVEQEVSENVAYQVALDLFTQCCEQALDDGKITDAERRNLDFMSRVLTITPKDAEAIEAKLISQRYHTAAQSALADGRISEAEAADLERLRNQLGLSNQQAARIVGESAHDAYLTLFRRVISDGRITVTELEELKRFRQALVISRGQANDIVREEVLALYREWFYNVIQDGQVTAEEEQGLNWLQNEFDLSSGDVRKYQEQIEEIKRLDAYRQGKLPSIRTRTLLEGGEICHWEGRCCFSWQTATMTKEADGDLLVTSERIVFTSPTRSFSFAPGKIMDIKMYSDALVLKCASSRGAGTYFVRDSRELEAILVGIAKRHKYQTCADYDSTMTRHIPDSVRREVWHRDGGKCARCSATDYLEYDHIIPHSRGGANTVKNIQLLCRRCNNLKSDRI